MKRVVPVLVCVVVVVLAWMVPEAAPARLSALQAYELLELPVGDAPADGAEDTRKPMWQMVVESPAARVLDDGRLQLLLHGTQHRAEPISRPDLGDHGPARSSIVRGLRQFVAAGASDEHPEYAKLEITGADTPVGTWGANFEVKLDGETQSLLFTVDVEDGEAYPPVEVSRTWRAPHRSSIIPPIVAVLIAILFRKPIIALFLAVFTGAYLLRRDGGGGLAESVGGGFVDVWRHYLGNEVWNPAGEAPRLLSFLPGWVNEERTYIIGFVFFMLAMVGVMTRSGGIRGLMDAVAKRANNAKRTQIATWIMGLVIFFDDYANTILVGSTMRPLTDRFKIAREKLAFIVDSTAAPVAGLSIFSTWIAFEVSTFNGQLPTAGMDVGQGYEVFLRTIPYSFYCFLAIFFVGLIAFTQRDFGPMLTAERRSRSTGKLLRDGATPMVSEEATAMEPAPGVGASALRAVLPLITFMAVTMFEIFRNGGLFKDVTGNLSSIESFTQVLYNGSGSWPLLVGSVAGFAVAAVGALLAGLRSDIVRAAWTTVRAMAVGFAILYLAWMIGAVCNDLGTAPFLTALVADVLDAKLLPTLLFLLAGAVAFATGSSWSTMSILLPLVVGLAYQLGFTADLAATDVESGQLLMVISIGAVLSGAIFGDHCSPISDTTVMSSIASASDHIDHVRTQVPYALTIMTVSIVFGYFPVTYFGTSPWLGLAGGAAALTAVVFVFGKRADAQA